MGKALARVFRQPWGKQLPRRQLCWAGTWSDQYQSRGRVFLKELISLMRKPLNQGQWGWWCEPAGGSTPHSPGQPPERTQLEWKQERKHGSFLFPCFDVHVPATEMHQPALCQQQQEISIQKHANRKLSAIGKYCKRYISNLLPGTILSGKIFPISDW